MSNVLAFMRRYVFALGACLYVFGAGFLSWRHRALIHAVCAHFGYARRAEIIPKVRLGALVGEPPAVRLLEPMPVNGNVTVLELLAIAQLVAARAPRRLFEIGTFDGRTTLNLAANCAADGIVYTLDLPADGARSTALPLAFGERWFSGPRRPAARFAGTSCEPRIVRLFGDSATFDFTGFERTMDFVFVDGSHSDAYVRNDSRIALGLIRAGGVVVWHDYGVWEGVTRTLNELYRFDAACAGLRRIEGTSLVVLEARPAAQAPRACQVTRERRPRPGQA